MKRPTLEPDWATTKKNTIGGYAEFVPPFAARDFVEYLWIHTTPDETSRGSSHRVVADAGFSVAYACRRRDGKPHEPSLRLMGPVQTLRRFEAKPGMEMVCVRIKMEWVPALLGTHPRDHVDAKDDYLELDSQVASQILERLEQARSARQALRVLTLAVWERQTPDNHRPSERARHAMEILRRTGGGVPVTRIASQLSCTTRSLRRWVAEASGLPPKRYGRLLRFHAVLAAADQLSDPDWASLAYDFGYFDQSHLIRDFREFGASTPGAIHRERRAESDSSNLS